MSEFGHYSTPHWLSSTRVTALYTWPPGHAPLPETGDRVNNLRVKTALLADGWADDVSVDIAGNGDIACVQSGVPGAAGGCLLPGMANVHSHAHQRAMAGLAERAGNSGDFWAWRASMYRFLDAMEPHHLHAVASQLYVEMLKAGYTRVAEFQYLHHRTDGARYDRIAEMSLQTLASARETGIGITHLPAYYQFGGFGGRPAAGQQRRFANDPARFLALFEALKKESGGDENMVTGVAAHSLRAITPETFGEILEALAKQGPLPVHIHIAEQTREVDDCIAWSGARPVEYLYDRFAVDRNWCLIHATHMTDFETAQLAASGAVAGLCPTTEANLGDGFFNAARYLAEGGGLAIGSDSHISVSPVEELRWLEYGQRLVHRSRNRLSAGCGLGTGRRLYDLAVAGGARACGHNSGVIAPGKRADFIVLDTAHPLLCERRGDELLDSWIFSGNQNTVRDVYVGGRRVVENGRHASESEIRQRFRCALKALRARQ